MLACAFAIEHSKLLRQPTDISITEMGDLSITLDDMGFTQLVFAFAFLTSYALAIGGMFDPVGRRRAALAACASAVAFAAMTTQWVNGALLVVCAIAGVGMFITLVWALHLLFGAPQSPAHAAAQAADIAEFANIAAAAALVDVEAAVTPADARIAAAPIAVPRPGSARSR
jgi:nitrate reductase NapE component